MFRSIEAWLCVFLRSDGAAAPQQVDDVAEAARAADTQDLFLVVLGALPDEQRERLRVALAAEPIEVVIPAGALAACLLADFADDPPANDTGDRCPFARLRVQAHARVEQAPWHAHFQTLSLQPARVLPLHREADEALSEADLVRAICGGSLLLLGDPGAGKTTSLLALARELAGAGPLTPLYLPLGRYAGDLWAILGEALAAGAEALPKARTRELLESGALVLLLDGLNEVQDSTLHARLVAELNELTDPAEPTARSRWIVSGRVEDYRQSHRRLERLEARRWEVQPLTADLIYRLLDEALGRGQQVGLYGIHKIGKSSLLEQLRRNLHLSHPELTLVQIELDGHGRGPGDLYRRVLERLPGLRGDLPEAAALTSERFRKLLTDYHAACCRERVGHRLLLIVDEYAYLLPSGRDFQGLPGFLEVLGLLKTLHQEGWLLLLPCGRSAALNRQARWEGGENPFIDLIHPCFLGPLPRDENDMLMTALGRRAQLRFDGTALDAVYAETGGHPSLSRALGSCILAGGRDTVTVDRVQTAVTRLLDDRDATTVPRAIYEERMSPDEQVIARRLAVEGPLPMADLFPAAAEIAERRRLRDLIDNLVDTAVFERRPDGRIGHRYGLMRRLIAREAGELGYEAPRREPVKEPRTVPTYEALHREPVKEPRTAPRHEAPRREPVKEPRTVPTYEALHREPVKEPRTEPSHEAPPREPVKEPRTVPTYEAPHREPVKEPRTVPKYEAPRPEPVKQPRTVPRRSWWHRWFGSR